MQDFVRVTDDVRPKRTYTILRAQFKEGVHSLVESDRDPATYPGGDPRPPRYTTTVDAEAAKKKATAPAKKSAKRTAKKAAPAPPRANPEG